MQPGWGGGGACWGTMQQEGHNGEGELIAKKMGVGGGEEF